MPIAAPRPCTYPGCGTLTVGGSYCAKHQAVRLRAQREADAARGSSTERGYSWRWRKARATFLRKHPLCAECARHGRVTAATDVDHIEPHRGDMAKFWDGSNWQPLCHACHSEKTAREDGGFGNSAGGRIAD